MTTRTQIVQAARGWLDTPYQHQQRSKGVAVDCLGLLIGVGRELGMCAPDFDIKGYSRQPDGTLLAQADGLLVPLDIAAMQPGDIVVTRIELDPCHLGIVGDYRVPGHLTIIHALIGRSGKGKVIEQRLDAAHLQRVVAAYAFPGVA